MPGINARAPDPRSWTKTPLCPAPGRGIDPGCAIRQSNEDGRADERERIAVGTPDRRGVRVSRRADDPFGATSEIEHDGGGTVRARAAGHLLEPRQMRATRRPI